MFGPVEIFRKLGCMVKNVEKENSPSFRSLPDHVDVFTKSFVVVRRIDRSISITFYVIIEGNFLFSHQVLEIIPIPFRIRRPILRKIPDDKWNASFIEFFLERPRVNVIHSSDFFQSHYWAFLQR